MWQQYCMYCIHWYNKNATILLPLVNDKCHIANRSEHYKIATQDENTMKILRK